MRIGLVFALLIPLIFPAVSAAGPQPSVLMIAIDDLNDWVGCLGGHPHAKTPNIDRLAARGTLFLSAHCQAPLCNPSRSSLLSGLRPTTTGIYGLSPGLRDVERTKSHVTLPETFQKSGYHTYTCGKVYHDGSIKPNDRQREFSVWGPAPGYGKPKERFAKLPGTPHPLMDWGPFPEKEEDAADYQIADAAIGALQIAPREKPFFIACGFRLPHVPCFAPPIWFDRFPAEKTLLPLVQPNDRDDTPRFSWYLHWKLPEPRLTTMQETHEWKPLVRAYLASTAFMDAQVGRVLDALERSGRADSTIVVLWSDHGYHLGEKGITGKNTLWERSTRVPLIFAGPGVAAGAKCSQPVELLDVFPTLQELTGREARKDLEGISLVPWLKDARTPKERPAITTHNPGNHAVRTERYRYIRYADGSEELYDRSLDPHEWKNLARLPTFRATMDSLASWLPKTEAPHAPGSKSRVLTWDAATKTATWEGEEIKADAAIPTP